MSAMFRVLRISLVILISYVAYNIVYIFKPYKKITAVNDDKCTNVRGAMGVEDIVGFGRYLIGSSDDRMKLFKKDYAFDKAVDGGIVLITPESGKISKIRMELFPNNIAFHPHGIYIHNNKTLYVINHAYSKGGERIEVFSIEHPDDNIVLRYTKSLLMSDELLDSLNGIAVLDNDESMLLSQYQNQEL